MRTVQTGMQRKEDDSIILVLMLVLVLVLVRAGRSRFVNAGAMREAVNPRMA